jgi:hypothetical protein
MVEEKIASEATDPRTNRNRVAFSWLGCTTTHRPRVLIKGAVFSSNSSTM